MLNTNNIDVVLEYKSEGGWSPIEPNVYAACTLHCTTEGDDTSEIWCDLTEKTSNLDICGDFWIVAWNDMESWLKEELGKLTNGEFTIEWA